MKKSVMEKRVLDVLEVIECQIARVIAGTSLKDGRPVLTGCIGELQKLRDAMSLADRQQGERVRELEDERNRLLYWLLECYRSFTRDASIDDGMTDGEITEALCSVLTNRDLDPNTADGKEHLVEWGAKPNRERY